MTIKDQKAITRFIEESLLDDGAYKAVNDFFDDQEWRDLEYSLKHYSKDPVWQDQKDVLRNELAVYTMFIFDKLRNKIHNVLLNN